MIRHPGLQAFGRLPRRAKRFRGSGVPSQANVRAGLAGNPAESGGIRRQGPGAGPLCTSHHALRPAFTLLELTVVISIIAILAAILFPVFAQAREAARKTTCQSNLHQIGIALQMYARDYDGRFPPEQNELRPLAVPYVNALAVFGCPSDGIDVSDGVRGSPKVITPLGPGLMTLPAGALYTSYAYRAGRTTRNRGDVPVASDWSFIHSGSANVLYLAGCVKAVPAEKWKPFARGPRPGKLTGARLKWTPFEKVIKPLRPPAPVTGAGMAAGGGNGPW